MSTIGFFEPVYIVPKPKTAENAKPKTPIHDNRYFEIRIDKATLKEDWDTICRRITNSAEFIFDFGKGVAYTIEPKELKEQRSIYNCDGNSLGWNIWQAISIVALVILFPIGIPLAVALYCIKDHHRGQVALSERDANKDLEQKIEEAKGHSLSPIKNYLEVYEWYLENKILVVFGIPKAKLSSSFKEIKDCEKTITASLKKIDDCTNKIATFLKDIEKCEKEIEDSKEKETTATITTDISDKTIAITPTFSKKKETVPTLSKNKKTPVTPVKKKIDPLITIEDLRKKIEELETTIENIKAENQLTITDLQERIFASLKNAIVNKMGENIGKINDLTLNLKNSEIKLEQSKILKLSKENKAELLAIRNQFTQLLEEEPEASKELDDQFSILGEEPKASKQLGKLCADHKLLLDYTVGIIDGILKEEEDIVIDQAKTLFGLELKKQCGKLVRIPKNGSCLFLSLVHTKKLKEKANLEKWNNEAAILRRDLVQSLRIKLENAKTFSDENFDKDPGFILKTKIQIEMNDRDHLSGYPEDFKKKIQKGGVDFIESEKDGEGWRAYLNSLEKETTFAGDIELSELPELLKANIHVYVPKLDKVPLKRDDDGRLNVFCQVFAKNNSKDYVFSQQDRIDWVESHKTNGKILPTYSIPEEKSYDKDIYVVLRKNHYDLYIPGQSSK